VVRDYPDVVEVTLKGSTRELRIRDSYKVQFAEKTWKTLLEAEIGNTIIVHIKARFKGEWVEYIPFHWNVVSDRIDPYLSYTYVEPAYSLSRVMQIRERNVENFKERVIADNTLVENSCINCHIYGNQDSNISLFHLRGKRGGSILNHTGSLKKLDTKTKKMISPAVYGNFHPSGQYGVFSTNGLESLYHTYGDKRQEVYNNDADLVVLDFEDNSVIPFPKNDSVDNQPFRTFPVFSATGDAIYYCEAPYVKVPDSITDVMYSLYKIDFNPQTKTFGTEIDTLFSAEETGYSVCHPKTSPDGKYIMYTIANYGTYPIWHQETDLQMINLYTGETDSLTLVNSDRSDSYHSWSSNSRWFVFASKRDDGIYGKPYFGYIDSLGIPQKPFVLPQFDPAWYDFTLNSFAMPELSKDKLPFGIKDIEDLYCLSESEKMK